MTIDLAAIREAIGKATPGLPWFHERSDRGQHYTVRTMLGKSNGGRGMIVATKIELDHDAAWIAMSPQVGLDLCDEVERLRKVLGEWKCPGCGGKGSYQQDAKGRTRKEQQGKSVDPHYQPDPVTCKVCNGHGLNPIASFALTESKDP